MGKNQPDAEHTKNKGRTDGDEHEEDLDDEDVEEGSEDPKAKSKKGASEDGDDQEDGDDSEDDEDLSAWTPEKVKGYVKNLRKENARYRKDAKQTKTELAELRKQFTGIQTGVAKALGLKDGDDMTPEEQAEALQGTLGATQFQKAVLEAAYSFGVPPQNLDYFEHLVQKRAASLDEGEELSEEDIQELAQKASSVGGGKKGGNTSVFGKGLKKTQAEEGDDESESDDEDEPAPSKGTKGLTAERFSEMGTIEKTNLAAKNPALYDRLMAEARRKRLINFNY